MKKQNLKTNKGITLIALVITIVVLLILAIVSIRLIMNEGIVEKSEYAVERQKQEQIEEKVKLQKAEMEMEKHETGNAVEITVEKILEKNEEEIRIVSIESGATSIPANMPAGEYYLLTPERYASNTEIQRNESRYAKATSRGEERESDILKDIYVINENLEVYYVIEGKLNDVAGGNEDLTITVSEAQTIGVLSTSSTTDVKDEYGNIIKVPAGFKITADSNNATEGIVIEDCTKADTKGSQFVWVPVGTVYKSKDQNDVETINLDRYEFGTDGKATAVGTEKIDICEAQELETSTLGNPTALNLSAFLGSVEKNKGYYIGRYEAGTEIARTSKENELTQLIVKKNVNPYNFVTPLQASNLSRGMYENNKETNVISDLINSYAWDTAVVFIQKLSNASDKDTYSILNKAKKLTVCGDNGDEYCKINDMSGNVGEWSTETAINAGTNNQSCVSRGGFNLSSGTALNTTKSRFKGLSTSALQNIAFRPILYL